MVMGLSVDSGETRKTGNTAGEKIHNKMFLC